MKEPSLVRVIAFHQLRPTSATVKVTPLLASVPTTAGPWSLLQKIRSGRGFFMDVVSGGLGKRCDCEAQAEEQTENEAKANTPMGNSAAGAPWLRLLVGVEPRPRVR